MIREKLISDLVRGKEVLDIGSFGQTESYSLWEVLKKAGAKSLTGVDLPEAKQTAAEKFSVSAASLPADERIVFGNMETHEFGRSFDVIVAGDIIEHVDNQALFLRNVHKHLKEGGRFVLTTPNAKWFTVMLKPNATHSFWHDRYTLAEMLKRCGFEIESFRYYYGNKLHYPWIVRPLILRQGMIVVARKASATAS